MPARGRATRMESPKLGKVSTEGHPQPKMTVDQTSREPQGWKTNWTVTRKRSATGLRAIQVKSLWEERLPGHQKRQGERKTNCQGEHGVQHAHDRGENCVPHVLQWSQRVGFGKLGRAAQYE